MSQNFCLTRDHLGEEKVFCNLGDLKDSLKTAINCLFFFPPALPEL